MQITDFQSATCHSTQMWSFTHSSVSVCVTKSVKTTEEKTAHTSHWSIQDFYILCVPANTDTDFQKISCLVDVNSEYILTLKYFTLFFRFFLFQRLAIGKLGYSHSHTRFGWTFGRIANVQKHSLNLLVFFSIGFLVCDTYHIEYKTRTQQHTKTSLSAEIELLQYFNLATENETPSFIFRVYVDDLQTKSDHLKNRHIIKKRHFKSK